MVRLVHLHLIRELCPLKGAIHSLAYTLFKSQRLTLQYLIIILPIKTKPYHRDVMGKVIPIPYQKKRQPIKLTNPVGIVLTIIGMTYRCIPVPKKKSLRSQ